jgi:hypothetical protein
MIELPVLSGSHQFERWTSPARSIVKQRREQEMRNSKSQELAYGVSRLNASVDAIHNRNCGRASWDHAIRSCYNHAQYVFHELIKKQNTHHPI